jgi:hypothetical protein
MIRLNDRRLDTPTMNDYISRQQEMLGRIWRSTNRGEFRAEHTGRKIKELNC